MEVLGGRAKVDRRAARQRDERIASLFDESYSSLRGLAFVMLGDAAAAEEVVMEAFEKSFSGWNRFRSLDHPKAYLRQIVVNLCRSRFRRQKVEHRVNALVHRGAGQEIDPDLDAGLDLWAAVRRLPESRSSLSRGHDRDRDRRNARLFDGNREVATVQSESQVGPCPRRGRSRE
jgi:DNA-directed RNA polymerase specialized sigma24 family protein